MVDMNRLVCALVFIFVCGFVFSYKQDSVWIQPQLKVCKFLICLRTEVKVSYYFKITIIFP